MRSRFHSWASLACISLLLFLGGAARSLAQNTVLSVTLQTNRGCGGSAVFNIGEPVSFQFSASKDAMVTLQLQRPDGTVSTLVNNVPVPGLVVNTLTSTVGNPPGQRRLILDAVAGLETAHAECTYTAQGVVTNPLTVTLTTNKGCGPGAVFSIGDASSFQYSVSKPALVTLRLRRPDGTVSTFVSNQQVPAGAVQTIPGTIGNPPGDRLLILDATAGTETAHAECTYTAQGAVVNPLTVTLTTNKGCGPNAVFNIGEANRFFLSVSKTARAILRLRRPDGSMSTFVDQTLQGGVQYFVPGTIGNPPGTRLLTLDALTATESAHAECSYTAVGSVPPPVTTLTLSIDRGCGSGYPIGGPILITYSASANDSLTLVSQRADGTQAVLFANQPVLAGQTYSLSRFVSNVPGLRTLILTDPSGAQATCSFTGM